MPEYGSYMGAIRSCRVQYGRNVGMRAELTCNRFQTEQTEREGLLLLPNRQPDRHRNVHANGLVNIQVLLYENRRIDKEKDRYSSPAHSTDPHNPTHSAYRLYGYTEFGLCLYSATRDGQKGPSESQASADVHNNWSHTETDLIQ